MAKLTLQYIWVEKYGCFENAEFNFSAKHHFHYDKETNTLTHEDHSKDYVEGFFGENIDLTAVVGNNGAGKTTLIKMICENFSNGCGGVKINCVIVMQVNTTLVCYYYLNLRKEDELKTLKLLSTAPINVLCVNLAEQKINLGRTTSTFYHENQSSQVIYYPELFKNYELYRAADILKSNSSANMSFIRLTQTLDRSDYREQLYGITDLSTSRMLRENQIKILDKMFSTEGAKTPDDMVMSYFHECFSNQIDFFCNYMKNMTTSSIIPFKLPDYVAISIITEVNTALEKLKKQDSDNITEKDKNTIRRLVTEFWNTNRKLLMTQDLYTELSKGVFTNFIYSITDLQINGSSLYQTIVELMQKIAGEIDTPLERCIVLLKTLLDEKNAKLELKQSEPIFYINYIEKHLAFLEFIINDECKVNTRSFVNSFVVSLEAMDVSSKQSNLNVLCGIKKFYQEYRKVVGVRDFLTFSWNLSSGEIAMLNLYSRFFSIAKSPNRDRSKNYYLPVDQNGSYPAQNALILIDEADMLFHPEWQQKYINFLLPFLKDIYPNTHLQIIIATHSPIMLSDIPKQNVIYLHSEKDDNGKWKYSVEDSSNHAETFGANIFRLFDDAFFLQKGAIGAFAEEKLRELLELIDNSVNENKEEIQKRIRLIGDPFLKMKIEKRFHDKLNIPNRLLELEKQMKKIQAEMQSLQKIDVEDENPNGEN